MSQKESLEVILRSKLSASDKNSNQNMDFVRSYFGTNKPLTSRTLLSSFFDQISTHNQSRFFYNTTLCEKATKIS